jgi:predicted secreted hydrolase
MVTQLRRPLGERAALFGSYIDKVGRVADLGADDLEVHELAAWTSGETGATYPSAWTVMLRANEERGVPAVELHVSPVVSQQELAFPRMPYWEGAVDTSGAVDGWLLGGHGYVELTGYAQD